MRYILTILISLLIFENLLAGNIKHRRIECSVDWDKERFKNIFLSYQRTKKLHNIILQQDLNIINTSLTYHLTLMKLNLPINLIL